MRKKKKLSQATVLHTVYMDIGKSPINSEGLKTPLRHLKQILDRFKVLTSLRI